MTALETEQPMLNLTQVRSLVGGVHGSTIYRWMEREKFPRPKQLGPATVRWVKSEVEAWLADRDYTKAA